MLLQIGIKNQSSAFGEIRFEIRIKAKHDKVMGHLFNIYYTSCQAQNE